MPKYNTLGHSTDMVFMAGPVEFMFGYAKGWSFKAGRWPTYGEKRTQEPYGGFSFSFPGLIVGVFIVPMRAHLYEGQKQPVLRRLWGWYSAFDQVWYYPQ